MYVQVNVECSSVGVCAHLEFTGVFVREKSDTVIQEI